MRAITVLAILLGIFTHGHCVEITQPDYIDINPGQPLSIYCKVSGYSLTDINYATHWIRQPAGKALEWTGGIWADGGTHIKNSLKNKFTITRHTASNTVFLQGSSLDTLDTAVYYCARTMSGYFDYWGKGTKVTVTSVVAHKPSVFPYANCGSGSDGFVTIACLAKGFMPDSLAFSWSSVDGTATVSKDFQYPSVLSGDSYSSVTQAVVKKEDWEAKKSFKCFAKHPEGDEHAIVMPPERFVQNATVYLMIPTKEELKQQKTATFACLAKDFAPPNFAFKWLLNGEDPIAPVKNLPEVKQNPDDKFYSATSFLFLNESDWRDADTTVSCEFTHNGGKTLVETRIHPDDCLPDSPIRVEIIPPSNEEIFLSERVPLTCNVSGDLDGLSEVWWMKGTDDKKLVAQETPSGSGIYKLLITFEEWANGTRFICSAKHSEATKVLSSEYSRHNGGARHAPSVFILGPAEQNGVEMVTLTCYAKDFYPKEVLITWLANDEPVDKMTFQNTQVIKKGSKYSVYSQFQVPNKDWKEGVVYTCAVYHEEGKLKRTVVRTIDSQSSKPANLSFNMEIPSVCKDQ